MGRNVTENERKIFALPVRFGGLGLLDPTETADHEFQSSLKITSNLKNMIVNQERTLESLDEEETKILINRIKEEKEKRLTQVFEQLKARSGDVLKRKLGHAREKGAGVWLTCLPIQALDYALNKQYFQDAICERYGWKVPGTPMSCACGKRNSPDHALSCPKGGYTIMRHNKIRDLEASILRDICKDVKIEPELMPVGSRTFGNGTNVAEKARLDVSAIGIWSPMERTFMDVRVVHPDCPSHVGKDLKTIYKQNEEEKKRKYNQRIIQVEKATFTPLVFTTLGGMSPECLKYHKRIAELVSLKTKEEYSDVMNHLRTRLRITLLKSNLIAIRGERGKPRKPQGTFSELSFNMIPDMPSYEV